MDTEQNSSPVGQTWYKKFSRWRKGQHFMSIYYYSPEAKKDVFLGRIYLELDKDRKAWYKAIDPEGKEIIPATRSLIDLEIYLRDTGKELADARLLTMKQEKETKEITEPIFEETGSEEPEIDDEPEEIEPPEMDKEQEIDTLRNQKEKDKDKGRTR